MSVLRGGHDIWAKEAYLPIRRSHGGIVCIKGINRIINRGDDQKVVRASPRQADVRHYEGLSIDLVVHSPGVKEAKLVGIDIGNVEVVSPRFALVRELSLCWVRTA